MSVKVLRIGDRSLTVDPATGKETDMTNVVFIEEGRSGANVNLSGSSDLLSKAVGAQVGLELTRTHTQPVRTDQLDKFPVGLVLKGIHITRELYSSPQMRNQVDKDPRMIGGRPTYFATYFSDKIEEDRDFRVSIDVLASFNPAEITNAQIGATGTLRQNLGSDEVRRVGPNQAATEGYVAQAGSGEVNPGSQGAAMSSAEGRDVANGG